MGQGATGGAPVSPGSGGNAGNAGPLSGSGSGGLGSGGSTAIAAGASGCTQPGQVQCSGACVNTQSDPNHCGSCTNACAPGSTCTAGVCGCAMGQSTCNGKCVDVQSDSQNCGACGTACASGMSCRAGQCSCGEGKAACAGSCVDLMLDPVNCGACDTKCAIGQACTAGVCVASKGGAMGADGCAGLAQNITLTDIAAYQTVEVPLMKGGTEVAASARNADVIAGRDTVFRLFVTLGSGWSPRPISARVFVDNGGTVDMFSSKKTPSKDSDPASLDTTFQVTVPKEKVTAETKYQVELVECGTGSGAMQSPRFPSEDAVALDARTTGTLKIKVLPLKANGLSPDTSENALAIYKAAFLAMYPISAIDLTVGTALNVSDAKDWNGMLDQVRSQRRSEAPANDVYYYGLLKPAATLREYCGNGCTAGIGFVVNQGSASQQGSQRAALGLAYADATSANTMAHEVGHNHGRDHSPCVPRGASISGVDPNYPYSGGKIGVYGWDNRSMSLLPPTRTDIMGYCDSVWISDYTYKALIKRVAALNGAGSDELFETAEVQPWRVLLLDDRGVRWGIPISEPSVPSGAPEPAEVLDAAGQVIAVVEVYRTRVSDIDAYSIQVPEPLPGWHSIRIAGSPALAYPTQ